MDEKILKLQQQALQILEKYNNQQDGEKALREKKPVIKLLSGVFNYMVNLLGALEDDDLDGLEMERIRLLKQYKKVKDKFSTDEQLIIEYGLNLY